jgi:hypothetical protein
MGQRIDSTDRKANLLAIGHLLNIVASRGDPCGRPKQGRHRGLPLQ